MRRRILLLVIGMTVLVVLAFAIPLVFLIRNAVAQRADDATRRIAQQVSFELVQDTHTAGELADLADDYAPRRVTISSIARGGGAPQVGGPGPGAPDAPLQKVAGGHV